jgi:diaminohydroxyphosphoribosylaminopyrimidine deaminase/5-amino-6-(5-phosphoribosylamino)uracil reductase
LKRVRGPVAGSTLYVNLEPCAHQGKTPPCADLIIRSGIPRVVVAMRDPNPLVSGRGIARMRRAGIDVQVGVCAEEARRLNRHFVLHITARRPYVHVKVAQTLDGNIAAPGRKQSWISSPASRTLVHRWRSTHDAVLVGAGTITADDPALDVRRVRGRNPDVVILDGRLSVQPSARVFRDTRSRRVFLFTSRTTNPRRIRTLRRLSLSGVVVLPIVSHGNRLPLPEILKVLYRHNIGSVLVEGGSTVFSQFVDGGPIDELSVFIAPTFLPGGLPAFRTGVGAGVRRRQQGTVHVRSIGGDALVSVEWER